MNRKGGYNRDLDVEPTTKKLAKKAKNELIKRSKLLKQAAEAPENTTETPQE
jgi:hypothetical protein